MSGLVNCFYFFCNVRKKGGKVSKPEYVEVKEMENMKKTEKKALEIVENGTDVLYEIEI
jgi:hypothetical protein